MKKATFTTADVEERALDYAKLFTVTGNVPTEDCMNKMRAIAHAEFEGRGAHIALPSGKTVLFSAIRRYVDSCQRWGDTHFDGTLDRMDATIVLFKARISDDKVDREYIDDLCYMLNTTD